MDYLWLLYHNKFHCLLQSRDGGRVSRMLSTLFCTRVGLRQVSVGRWLESVIHSIVGDNMGSSSFGHILLDIKLFFFFNNVFVCYARRLGNCVAHRLARELLVIIFLFGWSLFLLICVMFTIMISAWIMNNTSPFGAFSKKKKEIQRHNYWKRIKRKDVKCWRWWRRCQWWDDFVTWWRWW